PSYVLGGRGMEIVYDTPGLEDYFDRVREQAIIGPGSPLLVDRFLDDALEIDVDALYDGEEMYLGGIMEHIEEAGIHSGDSSCTLPPVTLGRTELERVRESTRKLAEGIGVRGLMNVQYALAQDVLYVLEANPRASRTVPFVAKATGVQISKAAARVMLGATIKELREEGILPPEGDGGQLPAHAPMSVKEAILPFKRFRTREGKVVDSLLGPEMRSTGEVMGIDRDFGMAFAKSQMSSGGLPDSGSIFVSIANRDKRAMIFPVKRLADLGFTIIATSGTAEVLRRNGIESKVVRKIRERETHTPGEPTIVDLINDGEVAMVVNTPTGKSARADGYEIRAATTGADKPIITTVQELAAAVQGIEALRSGEIRVKSLQDHARELDLFGGGVRR
ncbi:MAG TPA: ATP-grasp domain-containing protein, partial [Lapillicoccus sp.]|nr:ATP-grasp domain-containing protein [Lapillicoccus sp.]